ncbi:hypothetical protein HHK36_013134 [Tetracentron sinense]|uniref:Cystatin domain-containing protein n=1 Tax=Tetracentron sinense TaxID=13715 RepID=A0A835DIV1_TETSI|nr:hypothetical protein HHK36_013134 [Tetracentron sinense]
MATISSSLLSLTLLFLCVSSSSSSVVVRYGRKVGGRTEIKDVKTNEEVQNLGRFCVKKFNEQEKEKGNSVVSFSEVVEAQRQVVSGIKYYLKIAAAEDGVAKRFDAVVVVKPWVRSKEMVTFAPSTS